MSAAYPKARADARRRFDLALAAYDKAEARVHQAAEAYLIEDARAISQRHPARLVELQGGMGTLDFSIAMRKPGTWKGWSTAWRACYRDWPGDQPESLTAIEEAEATYRLGGLGAVGLLAFKAGQPISQSN